MGQRMSISQEQEKEFYKLFQGDQPQQSQAAPQTGSVAMMRLMAPTALTPQRRVIQPSSPGRKQRVRQTGGKARRPPRRRP